MVNKIKAIYFEEEKPTAAEKHVTGIGGVFFKSKDPKILRDWYKKHLGLATDDYGWSFWWHDKEGNAAMTQWSPFANDTKYFEPSEKQFMQNFRVNNLDTLLEKLKAAGVTVVGKPESYDYGKFGWILDCEGNKIELWEPIDKAFL
ncbi:VOC family protein [Flavobacterium litorale]|uniref:VOC family protein n=1 Tax=Flavobacterium litorale TaxID=2856519 RepID=UPI0035A93A82